MRLATGSHLGPYEIMSRLGAGGMGEVYRARDHRLGRDVAIKVLSSDHVDHDQQARLEREARVLSGLNHPHICTVHDVGHADGVSYLVMELLEGETLASRLERGPLPVALAIRHAIEIADALSVAHRNGVTHRDLKPGNIVLIRAGAKLLDFGLAKRTSIEVTSDVAAVTASRGLTVAGSIVGTPQYMAPEQILGQPVDSRTDIFALGAVMFEMV